MIVSVAAQFAQEVDGFDHNRVQTLRNRHWAPSISVPNRA